MEVTAKIAKVWFLRIPILGHCLKPISIEIQACQDVQTEPGNTLGRHTPQLCRVCLLGEKRSTKPPIWRRSGSTAARIMAKHAQLWGIRANIPNVPFGASRLQGHGRRKPRLWLCITHFIRPDSRSLLFCLHFCTFRTLSCKSWPALRECVCFYISSKWPVSLCVLEHKAGHESYLIDFNNC